MAKGSIGTPTNAIQRGKKPKKIPCDCTRCKHFEKKGGMTRCKYYDQFSPHRKNCMRYWCIK